MPINKGDLRDFIMPEHPPENRFVCVSSPKSRVSRKF